MRYRGSVLFGLIISLMTGCAIGADEPPFSMGGGQPGDQVRATKLLHFGEDGTTVYQVEYPRLHLTSLATIDMRTAAMVTETFEGRWNISYTYDDAFNKLSHLPNQIRIENSSGKLINEYKFSEMAGNGVAAYTDPSGHTRTIDMSYFEIAGSGIPGMGGMGGFGGFPGGFGGIGR